MMNIQHKFVEVMPDELEDGILYISIKYCTAIHKCVCGCGNEVVTPITPDYWKFTFDGISISLSPSIGNWNFDCKSHYWIVCNKIKMASKWKEWKVNFKKDNYLENGNKFHKMKKARKQRNR